MTATTPAASRSLDDIPGPKGVPLLGNMFEIKQATMIQDLMKVGREWGPIFKMTTPTGPIYVVYGLEMVDDLCDDARFDKLVGLSQREFRKTHKSAGLFTADTDDPLWKSAHDILLPSFSTWAMKGYLDPMIDIAEQLCLKWERLNPDEPIDVTADMTRLTLDTIALCGFSYRFNSFYRDTQHPFVEAMMGALHETQARQRLLPVAVKMRRGAQRQAAGRQQVHGRHGRRRSSPSGRRAATPGTDLLGHMLVGTDKQGNTLPDHNIVAQCLTFLVAGHETTSGLLSFAISYLLKHPRGRRPRAGGGRPGAGHRPVGAAHRRAGPAARLHPADPRRDAAALADRARVHPPGPAGDHGRRVGAVRARSVDRRADPDAAPAAPRSGATTPRSSTRTTSTPQRRDALPPNAFRPFGSGQRACIGRQFALQEATLVLGMLMQRFEFVDHANYQLKIKESLTLKPDGLTITIRPRAGPDLGRDAAAGGGGRPTRAPPRWPWRPPTGTAPRCWCSSARTSARRRTSPPGSPATPPTAATPPAPPGSTTRSASCRPTAPSWSSPPPTTASPRTTRRSSARGSTTPRPRRPGCATPSSAAATATGPRPTRPCRRGSTPRWRRAARPGCTRAGKGDARGDFDGQFEAWYAGLWDALGTALGLDAGATAAAGSGPRLAVELEQRRTASPILQSYRGQAAIVRVNRELTARAGTPGGRSVRHIEIALPPGRDLRGGRPPRGAAAQRGLPDQPGDRPLRPGRGPVRHAHRDRRRPDPPARRRAVPAARHPGGLRRAAGRREPRGPGGDGGPPARGPRPRRARGPGGHRRRGEGPLPGEDRHAPAHAARPARGAPRVRAAVRGVPRPAAAAAPALLLDLLVADDEHRAPR